MIHTCEPSLWIHVLCKSSFKCEEQCAAVQVASCWFLALARTNVPSGGRRASWRGEGGGRTKCLYKLMIPTGLWPGYRALSLLIGLCNCNSHKGWRVSHPHVNTFLLLTCFMNGKAVSTMIWSPSIVHQRDNTSSSPTKIYFFIIFSSIHDWSHSSNVILFPDDCECF